ncbi:MAG: response regulator [Clostridiales bacterium]|nr:response regulator [Clostridiales bacterium]
MKIMTVDDSAIVRKIIQSAVGVLEYDVLEAREGREALEILEDEHESVALILLDWNMPGMNGIEMLETIKGDSRFKSIPVMMVTSETGSENIIKAIQAGAAHYLIKPFTIEELTKRILECLGRG